MKIKSKISLIFIILLVIPTIITIVLFIWALILSMHVEETPMSLLIGSWFVFLCLLFLSIASRRKLVLYDDRMETVYLFGIIRTSYNYDTINQMTYVANVLGDMISLDAGGWPEIRIGQRNYRNFNEIKEVLESKIKNVRII